MTTQTPLQWCLGDEEERPWHFAPRRGHRCASAPHGSPKPPPAKGFRVPPCGTSREERRKPSKEPPPSHWCRCLARVASLGERTACASIDFKATAPSKIPASRATRHGTAFQRPAEAARPEVEGWPPRHLTLSASMRPDPSALGTVKSEGARGTKSPSAFHWRSGHQRSLARAHRARQTRPEVQFHQPSAPRHHRPSVSPFCACLGSATSCCAGGPPVAQTHHQDQGERSPPPHPVTQRQAEHPADHRRAFNTEEPASRPVPEAPPDPVCSHDTTE